MADRTLFENMPYRQSVFHEHSDGSFSITTHQDVEPNLEASKRAYNDCGDKLTPGKRGDWHRVAEIPLNVWEQWCKETNNEIQKDKKLLAKYLNDPDNKYFKTSPTNL